MKYKIDYATTGKIIRIDTCTKQGIKKTLLENEKLKDDEVFMSKIYEGGRLDAFTAIRDARAMYMEPLVYIQNRIERTMKFLETI